VIPAATITAWGIHRPWPTRMAVEQDLLLARTIVAIYEHPFLRKELMFRGGTCLHQVHLDTPLRYSEDLDFVRCTNDGIGPVLDALREVAAEIGLTVRGVRIGEHPKMVLRARAEDDPSVHLKIKIEINTHETSPARAAIEIPFVVVTPWFSGATSILTFTPEELISTKLRALYQRKKGRDLFDLWLALVRMGLDPAEIVACFAPYRPQGYTAHLAVDNLREKLADEAFNRDLDPLVAQWPHGYNVGTAGQLVIDTVLTRLE
jgi:predicted nucleotidyltransferase component of viral defense system